MTKKFQFTAPIWLYPGKAGWYFVTLPREVAEEIDYYFATQKRGWGSLPVAVTIGKTDWTTSIFPDKSSNSYVLPLKALVRKNENLAEGDQVSVQLVLSN